MRAADVDWVAEAAAGARIYVFIIASAAMASEWVDDFRVRVPPARSVLVVDFAFRNVGSRDGSVYVSDYMAVVLGRKAGVSPAAPYEGLAHAVLDALGVKVGAAFLSLGGKGGGGDAGGGGGLDGPAFKLPLSPRGGNE